MAGNTAIRQSRMALGLPGRLTISEQPRHRLPGARQDLGEALADGRAPQVLVLAATGAVADGDDADANGSLAHGSILRATGRLAIVEHPSHPGQARQFSVDVRK